MKWSAEQEQRLLELMGQLQANGMSYMEAIYGAAKDIGFSPDAVYTKLWRLKMQHGRIIEIPESRYPLWNAPFEFEGDALMLCDAHIPYHHAKFINLCIRMAAERGIRRVLMAGDALDLHGMSSFPENFERKPKVINADSEKRLRTIAESLPVDSPQREEMLKELDSSEDDPHNVSGEWANARETMTALAKNFDEVLWMMGNHEHRLIRKLERAASGADLRALFAGDNPKWKVSEYYWCRFTSGGKLWQVEHPNLTAKGGSKRLSPKYGKNIIMAHNHHFSVQSDTSGDYVAIEPGMCGDEERMGYVQQRHNAADTHVLGAVIVQNGYPTLINKYFMNLSL